MAKSKHIDRRKFKRKGWFAKEGNKPIPKYRKECKSAGNGYLGPRHEVHHVLPQTCIEQSVLESGKDLQYISEVQYITDWNINKSINLIGLPHYHSYDLYYQANERLTLQVGTERERDLISWFNKFAKKSRKKWLSEVIRSPPEPYPIHNPVNWGHTQYNSEVIQEIKEHVWDGINDKKKEHEFDAKTVADVLNDLAKMNYDYLVKRGSGVSQTKWNKRTNKKDDSWYEPFTMADVNNPIFG